MKGFHRMQTCLLMAISIAMVFAHHLPAQTSRGASFDYDRIQLISRFMQSVYPKMAEGVLKLQIAFPHASSIDFSFRPCRTGSGVPGGRMADEKSVQPQPLNCGAQSLSEEGQFFSAHIDLGSDAQRPISLFHAVGTFVIDERLQTIRDQYKNKPDWTEEEALAALRALTPKYGPEERKEFAKALPLAAIAEITGCKLEPQSAKFDVQLSPALPPRLEWVVRGNAEATTKLRESDCWAAFEPFHGRLTALGGFTQRMPAANE